MEDNNVYERLNNSAKVAASAFDSISNTLNNYAEQENIFIESKNVDDLVAYYSDIDDLYELYFQWDIQKEQENYLACQALKLLVETKLTDL